MINALDVTAAAAEDRTAWPTEACKRCGGTGHYSFDGSSTVCYGCSGGARFATKAAREAFARFDALKAAGRQAEWDRPAELAKAWAEYDKVLARRAAARVRAAAKAEAKRLVKVAAANQIQAANEALLVTNPLAVDATYWDNFYEAGAQDWQIRGYAFVAANIRSRPFDARTVEWAANTTERIIARANEDQGRAALTPGRQVVTGVVRSWKTVDSQWGSTAKMIVELPAGQRLWGTIPGALWDAVRSLDELVGQTVQFTASVQASDDDPTFGFFARPGKATVVTA